MKARLSSHKGRRSAEKKINIKVILAVAVAICIIICIFILSKKPQREPLSLAPPATNEIDVENTVISEEPVKEEIDVGYIPDTMGGYDVVGELVIDKIGLRQNILFTKNWNIRILDISVARYWSEAQLNEVGNYSIVGHNYTIGTNDGFKRLRELEIGDTFYIISKENKTKVDYQIYDKYSVDPENTAALDMPTEQVKEVTLITCNKGAVTRLICKAREI